MWPKSGKKTKRDWPEEKNNKHLKSFLPAWCFVSLLDFCYQKGLCALFYTQSAGVLCDFDQSQDLSLSVNICICDSPFCLSANKIYYQQFSPPLWKRFKKGFQREIELGLRNCVDLLCKTGFEDFTLICSDLMVS